MSRRAWVYIGSILLLGTMLTVLPILSGIPLAEQWLAVVALTTLAALTQLFKANAPNRKLYYPNLVFVFAGVLILHPFLYAMLVIVSYLIEWAKERLTNSSDLREWYLQPFNIAMIIISGAAARGVITLLSPNSLAPDGFSSVATVLLASVVFVGTNQVLLTIALVLARGMSWKEAATPDLENIQADLIHTLLGYVVAVVWFINPWLIIPTVGPLILTYRALMVPQLKRDASTDAKTGLWNAGHFNKLFLTELERAKRFGHPISVILSDLDLLRNVNNTYGHLAGDIVLVGIGQIIRSTVRDYDIAARFGGEEFTIVLPETGLEEAVVIAERLRLAVEMASFQVRTSESPIHVTMSCGVATFPQDGAATNDLIHQADVAVYQAKLKGRNCVVAATDVPHSLKLQGLPPDRQTAVYTAPAAVNDTATAIRDAKPKVVQPVKIARQERRADPRANYPDAWLTTFVGAVIIAGLAAAMIGLSLYQLPDLTSALVLSLMAVFTELYEVRLYGDSTFSVSVAIIFAAALITGIAGVMAVSLAIVFAHFLRNREIALYKPAFNWATHVLAGLAPLIVFRVAQVSLGLEEFIPLTVLAVASALAYFVIETGLVSIAIGLSEKSNILNVWRQQFQWMAIYYVALCVIGLFMGIIYADAHLGILGVIVVAIPVAMIYYAQKQYVEQTTNSVHELDRLNKELSIANSEVLAASHAIQQVNEELFLTVARIIDARDPYVLGHASKVADYASAIGQEMELPADRLERLHQAGLLHDLGKLGIAEKILNKPGKLTDPEYEQVKKHATIGAEVLEASQGLRQLATFVRHHHEWWNGKGYPDQWGGEQIPLEARILAVCDAVDSMASDRPYHKAMQLDEIIAEVEKNSGTQFDPDVVNVFKRIVKQKDGPVVVNSARPVAQRRAGLAGNQSVNGWRILPGDLGGGFAPAD